MSAFTLVIGNKNYSSWSLRPWLAMKMAGVAFEELVVPLRQDATVAEIARHSPGGKVPALRHGELVIWESIAILEYIAEAFPEARLWPQQREARAIARAVSAEMHAGFTALRTHMPMNIRGSKPGRGRTPEVEKGHSPHRRAVGRLPSALRCRRTVPVRRVRQRRRHVRAGGDPLYHLWRHSRGGGARLRGHDTRAAADAGVVRRGQGRALDDRGD